MKSIDTLPLIGITMGDPIGIGPEILVKLIDRQKLFSFCRPLVLGDPDILQKACELLDISLQFNPVTDPANGKFEPGCIDLVALSCLHPDHSRPLTPSVRTGKAMETYIVHGIELARMKKIDGLVTCPINKVSLKLGGSRFHGHTELLADQTHTTNYAMMLAGDRLKVVLVTIHIPLEKVAQSISTDEILSKIELTHQSLNTRFNIKNPRIAVAGLNPHAGEDGLFGREEETVILPAVNAALKKGIDVTGPLPPDTVFFKAANNGFDAVICMYHDQGLIPFKLIHFKDGVNTTLGLPIIRTSVDHGTAYDIAWKGIADPDSLFHAVKMAAFQAANLREIK